MFKNLLIAKKSQTVVKKYQTECDFTIIYLKCNDDWNIFSEKMTRSKGEELLAQNYAIKLCARHLLNVRNKEAGVERFYTQD